MKLLTPKEVSELFSLNIRQVEELARQGKLPAIKVGKLWRFPEDALRAWIKNGAACKKDQSGIDTIVDQIISEVA